MDIRLPIGLLFCVIGLLLVAYGAVSGPAIYARSLGININLWWGGVLILFGAVMLFLARKSLRRLPGVPRKDP
ncbi:MAG TPA: hypothetical protein VK569_05045 [Bacteroidota bacterium]|nr:hypothetical protein [Bacteroidota bacterium]